MAGTSQVYSYYVAKMKRREYHFPSPRRGRLTQALLLDGGLIPSSFLKVDQSSVSNPVFYRRSLPKKMNSGSSSKERETLVVKYEPELLEKDKEEIEESRQGIELTVNRGGVMVREIQASLLPADKKDELPELPPVCDRVSVVLVFRGGEGGRLEGLKKCIQCVREQTIDCYIILVEQDTEPIHQIELEPLVDSYLFTYSTALFNRSWALNCGVVAAPDDLVLLHDGDLLIPENYVRESIKVLGTKDLALPWAKIFYLTEDSSKQYPGGKIKISHVLTNNQAVGGSLLVRKNFYLKIGGMDEQFEGWGGEDNAFWAAAVKLGQVNRASLVTGMRILHCYHKPALKTHAHSHINNHILRDYYRGSGQGIMAKIKTLDPIGNPFKEKLSKRVGNTQEEKR